MKKLNTGEKIEARPHDVLVKEKHNSGWRMSIISYTVIFPVILLRLKYVDVYLPSIEVFVMVKASGCFGPVM
jgi:hypothetical protein